MSSATRCSIKVDNSRDPKEGLAIALSKLKKKIKDSNIFFEHIDRLHFKRPAVKRKEKAKRAEFRRRTEARRNKT